MEWIKISDHMPKENQNVLLWNGEEVWCGPLEMCKNKITWGNQACDGICYGWYNKKDPIYWMPMPQPPTRGLNELDRLRD